MSPPVLALEAVTLGYPADGKRSPERVVAAGVSLRFAESELTVVLGPNGGGKSTLLRTLSGLQAPLAGEVRWGETPLGRFSSLERAKRIAVVLTERAAPPGMTVAALVALGRHPHTGWLGGMTEEDHRRVQWALEVTDTLSFANRPANQLSDGERQRVWIARALAQDARILVLDEPTAFLDLPHRVEILRLLRRLAHTSGLTVILSTHDLDQALRLADRLVLLGSAGVLAGAPEDLVLAGAMNQLFPSPEVHFDLERAQFRMRETTRGQLRVNAAGAVAHWVQHVAERAGWEVGGTGSLMIEASVDAANARLRWQLVRPSSAPISGETAEALYRALASGEFAAGPSMKALSVLGTNSSAGKSWMTTALCAWLRREGVRVAPFKSQNMSNNAWATLEGGEMARAQAVQAEACGLRPIAEMNPILLKPTGVMGSQVIVRGRAEGHSAAKEYFRSTERFWQVVTETLEYWKSRCDVLVLEGAGSPVELNLMDRDLSNLRPIRHLDGRWVLVGDIDRGGVFAQLAGTWNLTPPEDRPRCLGAIVNRFRGDISLFANPQTWLAPYAPGLDVLGTVPMRPDLQPEEEDGFAAEDADRGEGETVAWVRYPHAANLTDCQPWWDDAGVRVRWTAEAEVLARSRVIVLPGSKNTIADLRWLRSRGLDAAIHAAVQRGALIIGICGGYQMLGETLLDRAGVAGDAGEERGLGLLPLSTEFQPSKIVCATIAKCDQESWTAYEIHMGRSTATAPCESLHIVTRAGVTEPEGMRRGSVWGTYLHGWFESPALRAKVAAAAGITGHRAHPVPWAEKRQAIYTQMAEHVSTHLNLDSVRRYLGI